MRELFLKILHDEVKPALGCTEPVAVALAAASAKEVLGKTPEKVEITVSNSIYKNGMCVGIPKTERIGLTIAACLGITGGNAKLGLKVLDGVDEKTCALAEQMMDSKMVTVKPDSDFLGVYVDVQMQAGQDKCRLTIRNKHDNIVFVSKNDKVLLETADAVVDKNAPKPDNIFDKITVEDLVNTVLTFSEEEIDFLWDGLEMNKLTAKYGMESTTGGQIGRSFNAAIEGHEFSNDLLTHAMVLTAAASDARMSGANIPVMSSNGSGNHGLTAILPIAAYADIYPCQRINVLRALAMSHLLTAFIKSYTGRLSAVCGCGVAAATGASLGLSYLMGHNIDQIKNTVDLMIAGISGMVCDGAKAGCAVKLALAAASAVSCSVMSKYFGNLPKFNGIVGRNTEQSIRNLGTVCSSGMITTDQVILDVMNGMNV